VNYYVKNTHKPLHNLVHDVCHWEWFSWLAPLLVSGLFPLFPFSLIHPSPFSRPNRHPIIFTALIIQGKKEILSLLLIFFVCAILSIYVLLHTKLTFHTFSMFLVFCPRCHCSIFVYICKSKLRLWSTKLQCLHDTLISTLFYEASCFTQTWRNNLQSAFSVTPYQAPRNEYPPLDARLHKKATFFTLTVGPSVIKHGPAWTAGRRLTESAIHYTTRIHFLRTFLVLSLYFPWIWTISSHKVGLELPQ
jgi:hypothetical protein